MRLAVTMVALGAALMGCGASGSGNDEVWEQLWSAEYEACVREVDADDGFFLDKTGDMRRSSCRSKADLAVSEWQRRESDPTIRIVELQRRERDEAEQQERQQLEQERAAEANRRAALREETLEREWYDLGCADMDPQLTPDEEARCDELAGPNP